jgi:ribosome biogenesis protein NSA1
MPRIISGDETGLVKAVQLSKNGVLEVNGLGRQTRARAVVGLCYHVLDKSLLNVARRTGAVETWKVEHKAGSASFSILRQSCADSEEEDDDNDGGDDSSDDDDDDDDDSGDDDIGVNVTNGGSQTEGDELNFDAIGLASLRGGRLVCCSSSGTARIWDEELKAAHILSLDGAIEAMCAGGTLLAAGGREHDVKLWDLETQCCTWKAKNVPLDHKLQLRIPVWVSALEPLVPGDMRTLLCGTAHRHIRLYDTRAKRRPTHSISYGDYKVTAMKVTPNGHEALIGDASGQLSALDLRKMHQRIRYAGPAGSVRSIALHPDLNIMACVGLDRFCRIYDLSSARECHTIYLKQRMNCVLFAEGLGKLDKEELRMDEEDQAGDDENDSWGSGLEYDMEEESSGDEGVYENEAEGAVSLNSHDDLDDKDVAPAAPRRGGNKRQRK